MIFKSVNDLYVWKLTLSRFQVQFFFLKSNNEILFTVPRLWWRGSLEPIKQVFKVSHCTTLVQVVHITHHNHRGYRPLWGLASNTSRLHSCLPISFLFIFSQHALLRHQSILLLVFLICIYLLVSFNIHLEIFSSAMCCIRPTQRNLPIFEIVIDFGSL